MIGSLNPAQTEVTVVGAGIAGLLIADRLDRQGYRVTVLEGSARAGGLVSTTRTEWGIAEGGPHSLLATPAVTAICESLGVELLGVRPGSRARYIFRDGKPRKFPLRAVEFARLLAALGRAGRGELTMADWARRHLGEAGLEWLISPFLQGVYAADPAEVSVEAAFPDLRVAPGRSLLGHILERKREKRDGPRPRMVAPRLGMGAITAALELRLRERLGDRFRLNAPVERLPDAPNVVLSVPAGPAARLIEREDARLAAALRAIRYTSLLSVTIFLRREDVPSAVRGVGVLVPQIEQRRCLGVLFNSSAFEGRVTDETKWVSLTMMLGGSKRMDLVDLPESGIGDIVRGELAAVLGIRAAPAHLVIHRRGHAIPIYGPEILRAWDAARTGWCAKRGRVLFANHSGQVSLRGMMESFDPRPGTPGARSR